MTPEKLNYLLVLAEEQNMSRAAKRLFITQPTLTACINHLEKQLGVKLFDRTHNPIRLTPSGKLYLQEMQKLVTAEQLLNERLRKRETQQQELKIGIGQIHSELWCADLIHLLLKRYPFLNVKIWEARELQSMEMLKNNEIDLMFGHINLDIVNFHFEEMCEEKLILIIPENLMPKLLLEQADKTVLKENSPDHPLLIQPDFLSSLPIIEPSSTQALYLNLKQIMQQYHIDPVRTIQTANMVTAGSMILKGLGYMYFSPSIFPRVHVENPKRIYYCTLPKMINSRKYYAVYKDSNPNLEIIRDTVKLLKEKVIPLHPT